MPLVSVLYISVTGRLLPLHPGEEHTIAVLPVSSCPTKDLFSYRGVGLL